LDKTSLIALLILTLAGGMLGSLGISTLLRSRRGRTIVVQWKWWGLGLYALAVLAVATVFVAWAYHAVTQNPEPDGSLGSPWPFFAFGIAAGLPFTLFTAIAVRHQAKQSEERSRERKVKPASRQERIEFAKKLEGQVRDYSDDLRNATVKVQGEEGRVLVVRGKINREQAERLVNVLRGELQDLGIERVESADAEESWWVRVGIAD
jgi:hypothetical protein